jgi:hypothetical protein
VPKIKFGATKEQIKNASGGTREAPKPGMYRAKVLSMDYEEPAGKDPRIHVVFELVEGEGKGYRIHTYLIPGNEAAVWKYHSFLLAVGLMHEKKLKGELNTDRPQDLPNVMLRTKNETYEGTERAKENGIFPLKDDSPEAEEPDEDEEAEDEETEEADEDGEEVDLDSMDRNELKAFIKEQELGIKVLKSMDDDAVRAAITEALGTEEDEAEDEEEEDDDEEAPEDYSAWTIDDLKKELESRGLKTTGPKTQLVKRLEESDEADPFAEE